MRRMASELRRYLASGRWSIWVAEDPDAPRRVIATLFLQRIDKDWLQLQVRTLILLGGLGDKVSSQQRNVLPACAQRRKH